MFLTFKCLNVFNVSSHFVHEYTLGVKMNENSGNWEERTERNEELFQAIRGLELLAKEKALYLHA